MSRARAIVGATASVLLAACARPSPTREPRRDAPEQRESAREERLPEVERGHMWVFADVNQGGRHGTAWGVEIRDARTNATVLGGRSSSGIRVSLPPGSYRVSSWIDHLDNGRPSGGHHGMCGHDVLVERDAVVELTYVLPRDEPCRFEEIGRPFTLLIEHELENGRAWRVRLAGEGWLPWEVQLPAMVDALALDPQPLPERLQRLHPEPRTLEAGVVDIDPARLPRTCVLFDSSCWNAPHPGPQCSLPFQPMAPTVVRFDGVRPCTIERREP